jgi:hypothetical protein
MGTGGFDVFLPLKQDLTTNEDDEEADIAMTDGLINEALMGNVGAKGQVVDEESSTDGDDDEDEDEDVVMEE